MRRGHFGSVGHDLVRLFGEGSVVGLSEGDLLRRYLDRRDEVAFGAIVARHGPMVLGVCRRVLRDSGDVEDAFQVTFLTLAKKAGTLKRDDPVGHWLYGVAYRVALRARSSSARRRLREGSGPIPEVAAIEVSSEDRELGSLIDAELARLPSKYRAPIVLCYVEGLTHEEAGRQLGWPVGTVKGRLSRARDLLKDRLTRRGAAPSAGAALPGFLRTSGAVVPGSLAARTTRAALEIAAGSAAGMVSASAVSLMNEGIWAMFLTKMKVTGAVLLTLAAGAAVLGYQAPKGVDVSATADRPELIEASQGASVPKTQPPKASATVVEWAVEVARTDQDPVSQAILDALEKRVSMQFPDNSLEELMRYVEASTKGPSLPKGIPIYVDPQGLQDADKTMASTISINLEGIPLKTTLRLALKQLGLSYEVNDGLLTIDFPTSEVPQTPIAVLETMAEQGKLTLEHYKELIEILKLRNEVAKLIQEKDKLDRRGLQ